MSEEWRKARTKVYYSEFRKGKVGEIVHCWFGNIELREGQIVVKKPNGDITVAYEEDYFRDHEEVKA